jgi:hypothetical protein
LEEDEQLEELFFSDDQPALLAHAAKIVFNITLQVPILHKVSNIGLQMFVKVW